MNKILLVRPSDDLKKGVITQMDLIPRVGEQLWYKGKPYSVAMVKYFLDADDIDEPFYKKNVPFVRLMLLND